MSKRPITIDTSGWGAFDASSPIDAMCERERIAFSHYMLKRLKKSPQTGSDEAAIWTGAIMALVQVAYAAHDNAPSDAAREALHQTLDYAWLQCASMSRDEGGWQ